MEQEESGRSQGFVGTEAGCEGDISEHGQLSDANLLETDKKKKVSARIEDTLFRCE